MDSTQTQILMLKEENRELKEQLEQMIKTAEDVLDENERKSEEIKRLLLQQAGIDNKIREIYFLLGFEVKRNNGFLTHSEDTRGMLDNIRVLARTLLHDRESSARENNCLRRLIKRES